MKLWRSAVASLTIVACVLAADNDAGRALFKRAMDVLETVPMFVNVLQPGQVGVLEVTMDFDFDVERQNFMSGMANLPEERKEALTYLERGSELGDVDCTFMLAEMYMYGNYSIPQNGSRALHYYQKVVDITPNATAHFNLGIIYATGLFGEVELNQQKANMHFFFAYEQGDLRAAMVLGYRYIQGIGLPNDCQQSQFYYQLVADEMMEIYNAGPLGGPHLDTFKIRVADFQDGIYGKGVGDMPSSLTRRAGRFDVIVQTDASIDDYSLYDQWYYSAITNYEGSYTAPRNFTRAFKYARMAFEDGISDRRPLQQFEIYCIAKSGYLMGHMLMRGEGVDQDFEKAIKVLRRASEIYSLPEIHDDLALIFERGPTEVRDVLLALAHYQNGTSVNIPLKQQDFGAFTPPSEYSFPKFSKGIEAYYRNARAIQLSGSGDKCVQVVMNLKYFVEAFDPLLTSLQWAFFEMMQKRPKNALIGYAMAAEQGLETAQASASFFMYAPNGILEDPPRVPDERRYMAKVYTTRSSAQNNLDSTLLLGDMYFNEGQYVKAASCYESASGRLSSQASFNLGWMHEMGYGVEQDYHLAKRYYDLSLAEHSKAYLPVQVSLLRLRCKGFINNILGRNSGDISPNTESRTWNDWRALYQKVRGKTQLPSDYEAEVQGTLSPEVTEPQEEFILTEDIMFIIFVGGVFIIFMAIYIVQQRQLRRRMRQGENNQQPRQPMIQFQFQFGFF